MNICCLNIREKFVIYNLLQINFYPRPAYSIVNLNFVVVAVVVIVYENPRLTFGTLTS